MRRIINWIKKRFLIISLILTIYFWGLLASLGLILGYFSSKFSSGPAEKIRGLIPSLKLSFGRYKLHLHHWFVATGSLVALKLSGIFSFENFLFWVGCGVALQGILCYRDWYKIIYRG